MTERGGSGAGEAVEFLVPYPVSVNRAWRNFRGRTVLSTEGRAYKIAVAAILNSRGATIYCGDIHTHYTLHPRLTASGKPSKVRVDLGNVDKLLSDAANGILWRDDSQITDLRISLGDPMPGGGVTVRVRAA